MNSQLAPRPSSVRVLIKGKPARTVELTARLTIGRSSGNRLVLAEKGVSRRHAEIRQVDRGRYVVLDSGSRNGTYVNGKRVSGLHELRGGDTVMIGKVRLLFESAGEASATTMDTSLEGGHTEMGLMQGTAAILMSDIRSYTALTARLPNDEFQRFVAEWFRGVIGIVKRHLGTIDRIVGDSIMAYWFSEGSDPPHAQVRGALMTSRAMIALMHERNREFAERFPEAAQPFRIGIGVNAGPVSLGNLGGGDHQAFTVLGDCVNLAARLESLCKTTGELVLTGTTVKIYAPDDFRFTDLGEQSVQGREQPLPVQALVLE